MTQLQGLSLIYGLRCPYETICIYKHSCLDVVFVVGFLPVTQSVTAISQTFVILDVCCDNKMFTFSELQDLIPTCFLRKPIIPISRLRGMKTAVAFS